MYEVWQYLGAQLLYTLANLYLTSQGYSMILFLLLSAILSCYNCEIIKKENVPSLGSWITLPLDAEKITKLTTFIEDAWYEDIYSLYWYKVKTLHASMQVKKYILCFLQIMIVFSN